MFVSYGGSDFFRDGIIPIEKEKLEYERYGLRSPLYSIYGGYVPGKAYTFDPMADSMGEMLKRTIIW
jgi:hypothetical protein